MSSFIDNVAASPLGIDPYDCNDMSLRFMPSGNSILGTTVLMVLGP